MSRADRILEKAGAGKKSAKYQQTRKGRRPIRAHNLVKKASLPGQDMRDPGSTPGQQKSPTKDSTSFARKLLSSSSAEVGPMPGKKKMSMEDHMIETDPLIQHLKTAAPKKKGLVDMKGALEVNEDALPKGDTATEQASESPEPTPEMESNGSDWKGYTGGLFDNAVTKKKGTDKDYSPAAKSVVDKVLGR